MQHIESNESIWICTISALLVHQSDVSFKLRRLSLPCEAFAMPVMVNGDRHNEIITSASLYPIVKCLQRKDLSSRFRSAGQVSPVRAIKCPLFHVISSLAPLSFCTRSVLPHTCYLSTSVHSCPRWIHRGLKYFWYSFRLHAVSEEWDIMTTLSNNAPSRLLYFLSGRGETKSGVLWVWDLYQNYIRWRESVNSCAAVSFCEQVWAGHYCAHAVSSLITEPATHCRW